MRMHSSRRSITIAAIMLCALLIGCGSTTPNASNDDPTAQALLFAEDHDDRVAALDYARDELILRVLPGAESTDIDVALARAEVTVIESITELDSVCVAVEPARLIEAAQLLADEPIMEAVQKNYFFDAQRTPQDPRFSDQRQYEHIGLPNAWELTTGSSELIAAVLDTGVQSDHPDLAGRFLPGRNTFDNSDVTADVFGHGTLVAGIIGARSDNGVGVAGINWETSLLPVRVTSDAGRASSRAIASGLVWATNRGARIHNVSFAPLQSDGLVYRAARYAFRNGGLVFISAGNDGRYHRCPRFPRNCVCRRHGNQRRPCELFHDGASHRPHRTWRRALVHRQRRRVSRGQRHVIRQSGDRRRRGTDLGD
jgi:thermitase